VSAEGADPAGGGAGRRHSAALWLERRFNLTEIVSLLSGFGIFPAELDTSQPLDRAVADAMRRPLPSYARWPRVLGLLSFLLFVVLCVTGALLAFYYQPTESEAHHAMTGIVRDVPFGLFIHQMHLWSARLLLMILSIRLVRFFVRATYKTPREALWVVAVLTLFAAFAADLTGRLLPWTTPAYWSTVRALEVLLALPVAGPLLSFLIGGGRIDSLMLTRFYVLHLVILPAIVLGLFYLHFNGVRRVGLAHRDARAAGSETPAVQMYNMLILAALMCGVLVTLVILAPAPFRSAADPAITPPGIHPPWYLLGAHAVIEWTPSFLPRRSGAILVDLALLALILVPFLDRVPGTAARERRIALAVGAAALVLWIALSWHGWILDVHR
jgi:quinol-cytochrome oxidoreductase complex cytochrome b subunit